MERRSRIRRGARVTTYIYHNGVGPLRCRTRNLSADGVFVRTDADAPKPGEIVSLVFALEFDHVVRTYRRWARVAHCSNNGIGMRLYREPPAPKEKTCLT